MLLPLLLEFCGSVCVLRLECLPYFFHLLFCPLNLDKSLAPNYNLLITNNALFNLIVPVCLLYILINYGRPLIYIENELVNLVAYYMCCVYLYVALQWIYSEFGRIAFVLFSQSPMCRVRIESNCMSFGAINCVRLSFPFNYTTFFLLFCVSRALWRPVSACI